VFPGTEASDEDQLVTLLLNPLSFQGRVKDTQCLSRVIPGMDKHPLELRLGIF